MSADLVMSMLVLATIALLLGAFFLWRRTGEVKNPLLMVVLALVAIGNLAIWLWPNAQGSAPIDQTVSTPDNNEATETR